MTSTRPEGNMPDGWPQPAVEAIRRVRASCIATLVSLSLLYGYLIISAAPSSRSPLAISGLVLLGTLALHTKRKLVGHALNLSPDGFLSPHLSSRLTWITLEEIWERRNWLELRWESYRIVLDAHIFGAGACRVKELIVNHAPSARLRMLSSEPDGRTVTEQAACLLNLCLLTLWTSVLFVVLLNGPGSNHRLWGFPVAFVGGSLLGYAHSVIWLGPAIRYAAIPQAVSTVCFAICLNVETARAEPFAADLAWKLVFVGIVLICVIAVVFAPSVWWDRRRRLSPPGSSSTR